MQRERERLLTLRHRWYAGGIATLLSGALIFSGVAPATAETVTPSPDATTSTEAETTDPTPTEEPQPVDTVPTEDPQPVDTVPTEDPQPVDTVPTEEPQPVDTVPTEDPQPVDTEPTEEPSDAPTEEPTPTPSPTETAPEQTFKSLALDVPGFEALVAGPDGATAPYVYWTVKTSGNVPVGGARFTIQGPRSNSSTGNDDQNSQWSSNEATVVDCIALPCSGPDQDSDPGEFLVKTFDGHTVLNNRRYRVQQINAAPTGYTFTDTAFRKIPGSGQTPTTSPWSGSVYSFGNFVNNPVPGATIKVTKRVLRDSTAYLDGAVFQLYTGASNPTTPVNDAWATCEIDPPSTPANSCTINVPNTALGQNYWVVEKTPAPGTFALENVAVGPATGNLNPPRAYPGQTGTVNSGASINVPLSGSGDTSSIGEVTNGIINPSLASTCLGGLNVALVLDRSTSIESNERAAYGDAVRDLVNALVTPANNISITPIMFNSGATVGSTSVASSTLANSLHDTLSNTGSNGWAAATNWDVALQAAANGSYNVVLMVTDGAPTQSTSTGSADNVRIFHIEQAVLSANAAKAKGMPVIAVGVAMPANSQPNLEAISGKTANQDFFTADWSGLGVELKRIAQKLACTAEIHVNKTEVSATGVETPLAGGWTFTAKMTGGEGTLAGNNTAKTTTQGNSVTWQQSFSATGQHATVEVTETTKPDWDISSVSCNGQPVQLAGDKWTISDFTLGDDITCTVKNVAAPKVGSLEIRKVVNGGGLADGTTFSGTYDCGQGFTGAFSTLTPAAPVTIGGIPAGRSCTVTENTGSLTGSNGLVDASYVWDVTGSVSPANVTIEKDKTSVLTITNKTKRVYGSIQVEKKLVDVPSGFNGTFTGDWSCVYPGDNKSGTWSITFTGGAAGATAYTGPRTQIPLTSDCTVTETTPNDSLLSSFTGYTWKSSVVAPSGATDLPSTTPVKFTVTNTAQRSTLKLVKDVTNSNGGSLTPADWEDKLYANGSPYDGTSAKPVPSGNYVLTEDQFAGYTEASPTALSCTGGTLTGNSVNVPKGANVVCTFYNVDVAPTLTLKKKVDNKNGIGTASSTEWTLSATGSNGGFSQVADQNVNVGENTSTTDKNPVRANVTYTLGEDGPAGYSESAWVCNGGTFTGPDQLKLAPGDDVTCTITNTVKTHIVKLKKDWQNGLTGASAALGIASGGRTSAPVTSNVGDAPQDKVATLEVAEGATVDLSETVEGPGTYATTLDCSPTQTLTKTDDRHQSFVAPAQDVTCTFRNAASSVTVELKKVWADDSFTGDKATLNIKSGAEVLTTGVSTALAPTTISTPVRIGDKIVLSETLGSMNQGKYDTSWTCTIDGLAPQDGADKTGEITVTGPLSCTVTNTPKTITVTVDKQWVNGFTGDVAKITVNGTQGTSTIDDADGTETDGAVVTKVVRVGDTVNISESLPGSNRGRYDSQYGCGSVGYTAGTTIPSFKAEVDVHCWFKNTARTHRVTLDKKWVDAIQGDKASLTINGGTPVVSTANGQPDSWLDPTNKATASVRVGDAVAFAETVNAISGSDYVSTYSCTPAAVTPSVGRSFDIASMPDADVICTFKNTNVRGKITLRKNVDNADGGTAVDRDWKLNADGIVEISGREGDDSITDRFVPVGTYELTETDGPAGYTQTNLVCTGGGTFTPASGHTPAKIVVPAAAKIVCTFFNDDIAPKLTLKKTVVNTGGGTHPSTDWTLSAVGNGGFTEKAEQNVTANSSTTQTHTVKADTGYTLGESTIPGYTPGSWSCTAGGSLHNGVVKLGLGKNVTCAITNTAIPASGTHEKKVTSTTQGPDGVWTIVYEITVKNTSIASTLTYDLADDVKFGSGIVVHSATWAGPNVTTPTTDFADTTNWSTQIATGAQLPQNAEGNATHVYTVTVTATIPAFPAPGDKWQNCTVDHREKGTGFLNESALTVGHKTSTSKDCSTPSFPEVTKRGNAAVQNPDGTWNVSYLITAANTGDKPIQVSVDDAFPTAPAGWSFVPDSWSAATSEAGLVIDDGPFAPGSTGTIWSGTLPANDSYDFTVSAILKPSAGAAPIGPCKPHTETGGLINTATVWSGTAKDADNGCVEVLPPTVSVEKDAKSVSQNADGTWLVTYLVSVTNDSATKTAVYDLIDVPLFGTDAAADDVQWAPADSAGAPTGPFSDATPIAEGKVLAPHVGSAGVDYYVVQITATINDEAWQEGAGDVLTLPCDDGGLLNSATATAGGHSDTDDGCIEPKLPKIKKHAVSVVQQDDPSQWAVTYDLTVTPQGTATFYDLADVPNFVAGVDIVGPGTAVRIDAGAGPDPVVYEVPVPTGGDPVPFVEDVPLGAAETAHVWRVVWIVDIPSQILPPSLRDCTENGGGLDNYAFLTVGDVTQTDEDCIPVKEKVYPDITKTVTGLSHDPANGEWEIVYDVKVSLAAEGSPANPDGLSSEYSLDEELDYDVIDVDDASWTGRTSGTFADGSDTAHLAPLPDVGFEPIKAGETHTYTITVHATITPSDLEEYEIGCSSQGEQHQLGFFNKALIFFDDDLPPREDTACTVPVYPDVVKTPVSVEDREDGTQRVTYQVTVTAPAPAEGQPVSNVPYVLSDTPDALPAGVTVGGDGLWHAEAADADTPPVGEATWDGQGDWTIQDDGDFSAADRTEGLLTHTYTVWADLEVTAKPAENPDPCGEGDSGGIDIWNSVEITSGEYADDSEACEEVHYDDVTLVKTSEGVPIPPGSETPSVEPGDVFDYVLTVTNNGTRPATGVRVQDPTINDRLEIVSITTPGFTFDGPGHVGNDVDLTLNEPLAVGASTQVFVRVQFLPAPTPAAPDVIGDEEAPDFVDPLDQLDNTACVTSDQDGTPDCDSETIETRDITATVFTRCVNDAPLLGWAVRKSESLRDQPITLTWAPTVVTPDTDPMNVVFTAPGGELEWSGLEQWPGTVFTPSGISVDYPGWRPIVLSDIAGVNEQGQTQYYFPGTTDVMTPQEQSLFIFNGLIADGAEPDAAWRFVPGTYDSATTSVSIEVNPELVFSASYPQATPECFVARHTEVQIEKSSSVPSTDPGKSYTYSLEVKNVSTDSAAEGVVVTDPIPSDVKITDVTWPGKGDASVFPNWQSCAVTGQNSAGYGGMLVCELYGPLQATSVPGGVSAAPTITLASTVNPSSKANVIVNTAVVDYYTFGDPEDTGRDVDDATVTLSALPATGGSPVLPLIMLGFLALAVGAASVVITRRRRGEPAPRL
ncbi:DUF5979 domain-containing protein [Microbacterium sp. BWT-B31]|uniref:DUF5979 domain-containing protein n=1 Tax=Microbacterium sp. BWT-B31 TaxID=3232072 RepID=UPI00352972F5